MTDDEARNKLCPFRATEGSPNPFCVAGNCMAWVSEHRVVVHGPVFNTVSEQTFGGYCRLIHPA